MKPKEGQPPLALACNPVPCIGAAARFPDLSISRVRDASPSRGHALSVAAVVLPIEKGIFEGLIEAESSSSLPISSGTGAASASDPNPGAFLAQNSLGRLRANHSHSCLPTGYHTPSPVPLQPFRF